MYAKKSLGQHFLKSERALSSIIEAGKISPTDTILEIGPGTGLLTERLLSTGSKVLAIEKDDELFELLKEKFKEEIESKQLNLIHDDILKFETFDLKNYKLIANIPYNITGAILEKFLSSENQPTLMVLLVQKEVAKRIVAQDGKESILSISVKAYGKPRYVDTVLAGSFVPAPRVDSAIISIEDISKNFFAEIPEKEFFKILKAGFQAKRKKLSSNLSVILDKKRVLEAFESLKLGENVRAEDTNLQIWQKLAKILLREGDRG